MRVNPVTGVNAGKTEIIGFQVVEMSKRAFYTV
jgi:hypothetical protein